MSQITHNIGKDVLHEILIINSVYWRNFLDYGERRKSLKFCQEQDFGTHILDS